MKTYTLQLVLLLSLTGTCAEGKRGGAEQCLQMNKQTGNDFWYKLRALRHDVGRTEGGAEEY